MTIKVTHRLPWFLPLYFLLFFKTASAQCNLQKPKNLSITDLTSCSATLSWTPVAGVAYYQIQYKQGNGDYSYINTGANASWEIGGLIANKNYTFSVASFCSNISGNRVITPNHMATLLQTDNNENIGLRCS